MGNLEALCAEYELKRTAYVTAQSADAPGIPPILTVIIAVIPVLLSLIKGGKFDPKVLADLIPTLLTALGVPAELIDLAKQIIAAIVGLIV